jgi:hypothetical protein
MCGRIFGPVERQSCVAATEEYHALVIEIVSSEKEGGILE